MGTCVHVHVYVYVACRCYVRSIGHISTTLQAFRLNKSTDIQHNKYLTRSMNHFYIGFYFIWLWNMTVRSCDKCTMRFRLIWFGFIQWPFAPWGLLWELALKTGLECRIAMFCNFVTQFNDFRLDIVYIHLFPCFQHISQCVFYRILYFVFF